ncbi:hypothetical protein JL49_16830 [Pseudoalteromonas luteoviolacea]|nr:hypothetical protein JL49_16830 [Pseudoalteromonas luteoviolacea]
MLLRNKCSSNVPKDSKTQLTTKNFTQFLSNGLNIHNKLFYREIKCMLITNKNSQMLKKSSLLFLLLFF